MPITEKSFKYLSNSPKLQSIEFNDRYKSEFKFKDSDIKELIRNNPKINSISIFNTLQKIHLLNTHIYDLRNGMDFNIIVERIDDEIEDYDDEEDIEVEEIDDQMEDRGIEQVYNIIYIYYYYNLYTNCKINNYSVN